MRFWLFGQVELEAGGKLLDVGTPRQQAVLAALIVDVGKPVAIETLIDRVWDGNPPVGARNVVYSHLSRLRLLFRHAAGMTGETTAQIRRCHAGYVLSIDPETVDLHRFKLLIDRQSDPKRTDADRAHLLVEALALWRGVPLAALPGPWASNVRERWHRLRLEAAQQWAQAELRLGRPAAIIVGLHDLVVEYPLVEPLEGLLMHALYAAGRGAEAINRYAIVRERLADEIGADPSPMLQHLHRQLLTADLALTTPNRPKRI
jgi:DNA-binding SARP family transcriptional activator